MLTGSPVERCRNLPRAAAGIAPREKPGNA